MEVTFIKTQHPWQYNPFAEPPLGFLSVAAVTREIPGVHVSLNDMAVSSKPGDYKSFADSLPESDVYCLSACTLEYKGAEDCAKEIKLKHPNSYIVAGGVHFDAFKDQKGYWEKEIGKTPFDVISVGEGEATMPEIINAIKQKKRNVVVSQKGPFLDLDLFPLPARDLLDEKYFPNLKENTFKKEYSAENSSTIMVSRGCPYSCSFCASPGLHNRTIRFRDLELVKKEVKSLVENYGISSLRWHDDNFPLNIWSKKQKGLENFLHDAEIFSRVSGRTSDIRRKPEVLKIMRYAGVKEIGIGVESAEDSVLKLMDKKVSVKDHEEALRLLKEEGFLTRIFLITGLPGETKDTGKNTLDFLERTQPDVVTLMTFDPYPGSDVFNNPNKYGITKISEDWAKHNIAISRELATPDNFPYESSTISEEDMVKNVEMLKEWVFNNKRSNVSIYNKPYKSPIL